MRDDLDLVDATVEDTEADDAASTFLTFDLDGQTLGVAVKRVREILDLQPLTRLPNAPHDVRGGVDVRGASVPIIDLTSRLGMGYGEDGPETRIVVFELDGGNGASRPVGILADRVRDVRRIDADSIEAAPEMGAGRLEPGLIRGLSRQEGTLVVLIDLEQVLSDGAF